MQIDTGSGAPRASRKSFLPNKAFRKKKKFFKKQKMTKQLLTTWDGVVYKKIHVV